LYGRFGRVRLLGTFLILALWVAIPVLGVGAQDPVNVTINEVDTAYFPRVDAYITVSDASGLPIHQLLPAAFTLTEDGGPVGEVEVELLENVGQLILLVLALDTSGSMSGQPMTDTKEAAKQLVRGLGPADQVALFSFDNAAELQLDFSSDKDDVAAAVDALQSLPPGTGYTALYDAVQKGAQHLGGRPRGRKALVVLTDGKDTVGTPTLEAAIDAAKQAGVPVYLVGFGANIQPDVLEQIATETGGHFYQRPTSGEVGETFKELARLLRYQYRVRFESSLQADDALHTLRATVKAGGESGNAEASYTAERGTFPVSLPGIADGPVAGTVTLQPTIESPGTVVKAEYLLDGDPLETVTTGEFAYQWDTTAVPLGEHTLTVRVTNVAGNQGEASKVLTVVRPFEIAFVTPGEMESVVGQVPLETTVAAVKGVARVEYRVDGQFVGEATGDPWRFMWNTAGVSEGLHTLTAIVYDVAGGSDRVSRDVYVGVRLEMPGLTSGQDVGGVVPLRPQVWAPGAVTKVEYLLDGSLLAAPATDGAVFDWDTEGIQEGAHTLTVRATDDAGNVGKLDVPLNVVKLFEITLVDPPVEQRQQLSGVVTFTVDVAALNEIARVEFAVDDRVLKTATSLPWQFIWDTTEVVTPQHTLAVTAYDVTGQSKRIEESVQVVSGGSPGLWIVLAVVLIAAGVIVPLAMRKRRRPGAAASAADAQAAAGPAPAAPDVAAAPGAGAWLVAEHGPEAGHRWPIQVGETAIGRSQRSNQVVLSASTVSRRHAVIQSDGTRFVYSDLQPTHPSIINGTQIVGYYELQTGDRIQIGEEVVLQFTMEG
jgi:VWFA-related protein